MTSSPRRSATSSRPSKNSGDHSTGIATAIAEPLTEMVDSGFKTAATALEEIVESKVHDYGPEYLDEALDKAQEALKLLVAWGKKNPVTSAAAATALVGITAFGLAIMKRRAMHKHGQA